jgi:hypothetical protein
MAKLNHAQLTRITIRDDRAAEMRVTLPAPPCGIEISPGARAETTPCGPVIRAYTPRPARPRLHPLQVALRAMMGGP